MESFALFVLAVFARLFQTIAFASATLTAAGALGLRVPASLQLSHPQLAVTLIGSTVLIILARSYRSMVRHTPTAA